MKLAVRIGCASFLLWLAAGIAAATSVRVVNLPEMVELADRVFWGRCLSAEPEWHPDLGKTVVRYRFEVLSGIKGVQTGRSLDFRQVQSAAPGRPGIPGLPAYRKGEEILLFLHGDSRLGLTSPVGLAQGAFEKRLSARGEPLFANQVENRNLSYGMEPRVIVEAGISRDELQILQEGRPIPLQSFVSIVQKLESHRVQKRRSLR